MALLAMAICWSPKLCFADTIGFWRFDEAGASDGAAIDTAASEVNSPTLDAAPLNGVLYSNDVPGSLTQDPVSGASWSNRFSQDASGGNARVSIPSDAVMNPENGFTVEFFIKMVGEPGGWHPFVRRTVANQPRWQIDFDHNTQNNNFGDIRTRWDTPDGDDNNVAKGEQIYIDTDSGSGDPADYDDADVALDGDGDNDAPEWHHVALTWDPDAKEFAIFTDYVETGRKALVGTFIHPDAPLTVGKHSAETYGMLFDEFRYSSGVLGPDAFLKATSDSSDSDGDGLPDAWEQLFFGSLAQGAAGDPDGDGLSNINENERTTKPNVADSDGDGLSDGAEVTRGTDPVVVDSDGDLLGDGVEVSDHGTDPAKVDTDSDGFSDGVEIAAGTIATDVSSKPADGNVYFVGAGRRWDETAWSDGNVPGAGRHYKVVAGLVDKLTNPRVAGAVFAGDSLTVSGEGAQLGIDRNVSVSALTLTDGGALVSDGSTFEPKLTGSVTIDGNARLTIPASGRTLEIAGPVSGTGAITVMNPGEDSTGPGTVILSGSGHSFAGTWRVTPGITLKVQSAGALDKGDVTLADGGLDADYNINNPSGKLILEGAETKLYLDQDHIFGGFFIGELDLLALAQDNGIALDGVFTYETLLSLEFPEETLVDGGGSITISLDSDGDGLADSWEIENFGNLAATSDGDPDADSLNNAAEILAGSNPNEADTDGDTLPDGQEVNELGSDPRLTDTDGDTIADNTEVTNGTSPILEDTDSDTLNDGDEITASTDPNDPDTDDDTYPDGVEVSNGSDPLSSGSSPPLFVVRVLKGSGGVNSIDNVLNLRDGNGVAEEVVFYDTTVNFTDNLTNTRLFPEDRGFPFAVNENLAIVATGPFLVDRAGTYSIGCNSDDGFRVNVDGQVAVEFLAGRGTAHTVAPVELAAGEHQLEFLYWQGGGGASVELYISSEPASVTVANDAALPDSSIFALLTSGQLPTTDDDKDGLPDAFEQATFGNLDQTGDGDADSDGLSNRQEFNRGSNATLADTDGDGLNDGAEITAGTDLFIADTDADGLSDGDEVNTHGSNPLLVDTDNDGYSDPNEVAKSKDPNSAASFPGLEDLVAPDPVIRYDFEETSGIEIVNGGSSATAGTLVGNNAQWLDTAPNPGGGNYILIPNEITYIDTNLTASQLGIQGDVNYTAMAWVWSESEPSGDPADAMIFGQPSGNAWHLGIRADQYHFGHWGNDSGSGATKVTSQEWHHVAWKYEGGVQTIHVDGTRVSSMAAGALDNDVNVIIGAARIDENRDFVGFLDDVRIYNTALGDADIAIIALSGASDGGGGTVTDDADNDGQSDAAEAIAGTDPNDPTSHFHLTQAKRLESGVSLTWSSVAGKSYAVEYSASLEANSWTVIGTVDTAVGTMASYEDTDAARLANPSGYYRARVDQ